MYDQRKKSMIWAFLLIGGATACTTVGPRPAVAVLEDEVRATTAVDKVLVAPTTGGGTAVNDEDFNKAVPAAAYGRYKDSLIIAPSLTKALASLHQPKVAPMLLLNWEVAFYQWVKDGKESEGAQESGKELRISRAREEMELAVPDYGKAPKGDKELKALAKTLKKNLPAYREIGKIADKGNIEELGDSVSTHKEDLEPTEALLRHIINRFQITYVLVSHVEGEAIDYAKNRPVVLHVALVNAETGKFRYYARSIGRKSDLATTYPNMVAIMAHNMFDDLSNNEKINDGGE